MKKIIPVLLFSLVMAASCNKVDININDPQHIEFLDIIPQDLITAFGEENIHFGHTPPNLENVCFYVDGLKYEVEVCNHYIYGPNHEPMLGQTLTDDPIKYYHCFFDYKENIISDSLLYFAPGEDRFMMAYDTVYVIGSEKDSTFTAYFIERPNSKYHPTQGILLSGKLTKNGIKNFRVGKKIIDYRDPLPAVLDVYLPGSIDIKYKDNAPFFLRDTCTRWQQYN